MAQNQYLSITGYSAIPSKLDYHEGPPEEALSFFIVDLCSRTMAAAFFSSLLLTNLLFLIFSFSLLLVNLLFLIFSNILFTRSWFQFGYEDRFTN